MTNVRMAALYSEVLLDHFRNPRNYGSLPTPDVTHEIFNPLCGDRIRIELEIRDGRIETARFVGDGCAISIAAASMLTEMIIGAEIDHQVSHDQLLSSLKSDIKPSRIRCALLSLEALRSGVESYKQQAAGR
jgi:nitrogen fixation NifU-like protein